MNQIFRRKKLRLWMILLSVLLVSCQLFCFLSVCSAEESISDQLEQRYAIKYNSRLTGSDTSLSFYYSDALFSENADVLNKELGIASVCLAMAAYSRDQSKDILGQLGFEDVFQANYLRRATVGDNNFVAYSIARKQIVADGLSKNLVIVLVRGTVGNYEWYSNFNVDGAGSHEGFYTAEAEIEKNVIPYLEEGDAGQNLLWVTGHSRGASVANILAGKFSLEYGDLISADHVYRYTFAPASVSINADPSLNNIYNYCNPGDMITQVPLKLWGYKRFGMDVSMPDRTALKKVFEALTGLGFDGFLTRQSVVSEMEKWTPTVKELCEKKRCVRIGHIDWISKQDILKAMSTFMVKDSFERCGYRDRHFAALDNCGRLSGQQVRIKSENLRSGLEDRGIYLGKRTGTQSLSGALLRLGDPHGRDLTEEWEIGYIVIIQAALRPDRG